MCSCGGAVSGRRRAVAGSAEEAGEQGEEDGPAGFVLPEKAVSREGEEEAAEDLGEALNGGIQLPLNDRFGLAYTCGRCGTRNLITVNRIAWTEGVVLATCRGCKARHLLADNSGLLDLNNDTGFTNVVELVESSGEKVLRVDRSNAEALSALNLTIGPDGKLALSEESVDASESGGSGSPSQSTEPAGEEVRTQRHEEHKAATDAGTAAPDPGAVAPSGGQRAAGGVQIGAQEEEEVDTAPLVFQLPAGASKGDVLSVSSEFGTMHVPVPPGAFAGCRIEVQGMVEVGLETGEDYNRWVQAGGEGHWEQTAEWSVGDVVAVNMPEGAVARIRIPESAALDATLRIAYPVVVLPAGK